MFIVFIEKNLNISRPRQFTSMLLKGQLYISKHWEGWQDASWKRMRKRRPWKWIPGPPLEVGSGDWGAQRRSVSPSGPKKLWALLSWQQRGWPKVKESSTPFPADPYGLLAYTSFLVFYSQRSQNGRPHSFSKLKCYIKNDNKQISRITWLNGRSERSVPLGNNSPELRRCPL